MNHDTTYLSQRILAIEMRVQQLEAMIEKVDWVEFWKACEAAASKAKTRANG